MYTLKDIPNEVFFNMMMLSPETIPILTSVLRDIRDLIYGSKQVDEEHSKYLVSLINNTRKHIKTNFEEGDIVLNNLKHGIWKFSDEEKHYKLNKLHGPYIKYYEDGKTMIRANYVDNKLEGEYIQYFEDSRVQGKFIYINGLLNGYAKYYSDSNGRWYEGYFKGGKFIREWIVSDERTDYYTFYEDGRMVMINYNSKTESFIDPNAIYTSTNNIPQKIDIEQIETQDEDTIIFYPLQKEDIQYTFNNYGVYFPENMIEIAGNDNVNIELSKNENVKIICYRKFSKLIIKFKHGKLHKIIRASLNIKYKYFILNFDDDMKINIDHIDKIFTYSSEQTDELKYLSTFDDNLGDVLKFIYNKDNMIVDELYIYGYKITQSKVEFANNLNQKYAEYIVNSETSILNAYSKKTNTIYARFVMDDKLKLVEHEMINLSKGKYKNGKLCKLKRSIGSKQVKYEYNI